MNRLMIACAVAALLAACAQSGTPVPGEQTSTAFDCDDIGLRAEIRRVDSERIEIHIDNSTAVLSQVPAASGERYAGRTGLWGSGGQWHQKGDTAVFAYTGLHGNQTEVVCRRTR